MTSSKPLTLSPRSRPAIAAIRLGQSDRSAAEMRHGAHLLWFMRGLALAWIAQGLLDWSLVLVGNDNGLAPIEAAPSAGLAIIAVLAVLDLIAAVGLWLVAPWGGVVWLVAVATRWFGLLVLPGFLPFDVATGAIDLVLVLVYFLLTYRAAREFDR